MSYPDKANKMANNSFVLVHSDVWGPYLITSKLGFKYFIIFMDDYSRVTGMYLMKNHSGVFFYFSELLFGSEESI